MYYFRCYLIGEEAVLLRDSPFSVVLSIGGTPRVTDSPRESCHALKNHFNSMNKNDNSIDSYRKELDHLFLYIMFALRHLYTP